MDASLPEKPKQSRVERSGFEQTFLLLQGGGAYQAGSSNALTDEITQRPTNWQAFAPPTGSTKGEKH
jgi:hypothetical protein